MPMNRPSTGTDHPTHESPVPRYWKQPATVFGNVAVSALLALLLVPAIARAANNEGGQEFGIIPFVGVIVILFILASMASQALISWRVSRRQ